MKIRSALSDRTVWQLGLIFLFSATGFYGYSFWSPLIIKSLLGISDLGIGLVLAAISALTMVGMQLNGAHSDRTGERPFHIAVPSLVMAIAFVGCALLGQPLLAIFALALVPLGHCGSYGPFWAMPTQFLTGPAAAAGIALVTTIANVGGIAGPWLIGLLETGTGTHRDAFLLLGGLALIAAILACFLPRVKTESR
jgi:predicted MFS family arabinose efflux permease